MALSEVQICNLALGWLGAELITSLGDDNDGAKLCNVNYPSARDTLLEMRDWSFAIKRRILTPLLEPPVHTYSQAFLIPADVIRTLMVDDTTFADNLLDWTKEGNQILANVEKIYITYISRITDTVVFTPTFAQALAQRLAADMAIPLTESRTLQESHWALFEAKFEEASTSDSMQGKPLQTRTRTLTAARTHGFLGS